MNRLAQKSSHTEVGRRRVSKVRDQGEVRNQSVFTGLHLHSSQRPAIRCHELKCRRRHPLNPKATRLEAASA